MLIVCPSCGTSYDVDVASLQPNGRQVRCVRCRTVWRAAPSRAAKLMAAAEAIAPGGAPAQAATTAFAEDVAPEGAATGPEAEWSEFSMDAELPDDENLAAPQDEFDTAAAAMEDEAPPLAPVGLDVSRLPMAIDADRAAEPPEDIETFAARRSRPRATGKSSHWPLSRLQNAILVLLIANGVIIGWRSDLVRLLPQTAPLYKLIGLSVNLRGLAFADVATTTQQHEGVPILVVEGNIVNDTSKIVDVPRLKLAVRNAAHEEIYSWTAVPPRTSLPPGETVAFRTRLASPPLEAHDVLVRFLTRQDILSGAR